MAIIIINGRTLTNAQVLALRSAICGLITEMSSGNPLGIDAHGIFMAKSYTYHGKEILGMIDRE